MADTLRTFMSEVVTSGTGRAAAVRGQQVAGKTGTAEFGTGTPPSTHAWFIGFRGNLAFAVLVEGGGVGGQAAAPIAARFLSAVPG
jgi:cell division protein FtsI/penicillin-binding protein 2